MICAVIQNYKNRSSLIGTYDKLYQFAYLNESEAVTTTQRVFTTTIDVYGLDSSVGVCTVADGTQNAVSYPESDGSATTVTVSESAAEPDSKTSAGTYVAIAGGILVVGGCVIAVAANKRKK